MNLLQKVKDIVKSIIEFQTKITPDKDKLAHFFWGFWYVLIGASIDYLVDFRLFIILIPLSIAVYKEYLYDRQNKGSVEFLDVIYTIAPSFIIYLL